MCPLPLMSTGIGLILSRSSGGAMPPFGSAGKCLREESVGCGPGLRPGPGGSPEPSFGRKLLRLAQASSKVPSTEKCSLDNKALTFSCDRTAARNCAAISPSSSRSRFLVKGCRIPHRVLDAEPDKPAEQQIMVDPLDQQLFRADRIECLQQQGAHQPLRRDRL